MAGRRRPSILIIRLGAVGDVVNVAPAVSILRDQFPDARIAWLVEDRASDVVDLFCDVDEKIVFERRRWSRDIRSLLTAFRVVRETGRFLSRLRHPRFDVSLDFQANLKSGVLGMLARARERVGFAEGFCREGNDLFTGVRYAPSQSRVRRPDRHLALLRHFEVTDELRLPRAKVPEWAEREVDEFLSTEIRHRQRRRIVAIHAGTSSFAAFKRWPPGKFAVLADHLIEDLGCAVVFTWGPGEREIVQTVLDAMSCSAVALPGPPSLLKSAALFRRSALMIGGDTGPLHLAAALGAPVVGIYGPKDTGLYAPSGDSHILVRPNLPCGPCGRRKCPEAPCMRSIRVETVLDAARTLLASARVGRAIPVPEIRQEQAGALYEGKARKGVPPYRVTWRPDGLLSVSVGKFRGAVDPSANHHDLLTRLANPASFFNARGAEWLINRRDNKVCSVPVKVEVGARQVHVKRWLRPESFGFYPKRVLPSRAGNAWRTARCLRKLGVPTPTPLAVVERRAFLSSVESVLVTETVPSSQTAREIFDSADLPDGTRGRLIAEVAHCVAQFHSSGHCHGALKLKSILVQDARTLKPKAHVIDLDLARRLRFMPSSCRDLFRARDLRSLNGSLHGRAQGRERERFLVCYARHMGWSRRRTKTVAFLAGFLRGL